MVKLSEFIGEMVSDISDARRIADSNSIAMSQSYHADPFLKGMPVPHYTIQEAEIKVPVSVNKVTSNLKNNDLLQPIILSTIKLKLPKLLINKFINFYIKRMEKEQKKDADTSTYRYDAENNSENKPNVKKISSELRSKYDSVSIHITEELVQGMKEYLNGANLEFIKLLDIKDKFVELLTYFLSNEFPSKNGSSNNNEYSNDEPNNRKLIFSSDDIHLLADEAGREMFFEFKQRSESEKGLFIEPNTGKLNEYIQKDNLLFMTIKIKEQDLDMVIEDGVDGEQRFLSLN